MRALMLLLLLDDDDDEPYARRAEGAHAHRRGDAAIRATTMSRFLRSARTS